MSFFTDDNSSEQSDTEKSDFFSFLNSEEQSFNFDLGQPSEAPSSPIPTYTESPEVSQPFELESQPVQKIHAQPQTEFQTKDSISSTNIRRKKIETRTFEKPIMRRGEQLRFDSFQTLTDSTPSFLTQTKKKQIILKPVRLSEAHFVPPLESYSSPIEVPYFQPSEQRIEDAAKPTQVSLPPSSYGDSDPSSEQSIPFNEPTTYESIENLISNLSKNEKNVEIFEKSLIGMNSTAIQTQTRQIQCLSEVLELHLKSTLDFD